MNGSSAFCRATLALGATVVGQFPQVLGGEEGIRRKSLNEIEVTRDNSPLEVAVRQRREREATRPSSSRVGVRRAGFAVSRQS
jgi:hypothetical protein